ncbi:MAG: (d)CMP kinase [Gammaproteobacteria bacterium]|nr:MAG: (d)CMP kinase [Gammaproteobacteria bacterium]
MSEVPVIAVDGPSGVGKGTVCKYLAKKLGWHLLDSGALYRVLAIYAERLGVKLDDERALAQLAYSLPVTFHVSDDSELVSVWLDGDNVDDCLRTEETGRKASMVASLPAVRDALLARQRAFRQPPGLVADGRDMGTVVFPNAEVKIFMDASAEARAQRRYNQLKQKGVDANIAALLEDIKTRDERDRNRPVAPLRPADDAVVLDTTTLTVEQVLDRVWSIVLSKLPLAER